MNTNTITTLLFTGSYAVDEIGAVTGTPIMEFAVSVIEAGVTYRVVGTFERKGRSLDFCYRLARRFMMLTRETLRKFGVFHTTVDFKHDDFTLWAEKVAAC